MFDNLPCPCCGEADGIAVHLETGEFHCHWCENDFDREAVEQLIAAWRGVFAWMDTAAQFRAMEGVTA